MVQIYEGQREEAPQPPLQEQYDRYANQHATEWRPCTVGNTNSHCNCEGPCHYCELADHLKGKPGLDGTIRPTSANSRIKV